jgi:hypothetical protein
MRFHEGARVREKITHQAGVVTHVYADGWVLVQWDLGDEDHAEPCDLEPDPSSHR